MDHNESSPDFSEALLYKANADFIEGNRLEPHNAKEIQAMLPKIGSLVDLMAVHFQLLMYNKKIGNYKEALTHKELLIAARVDPVGRKSL